MCRATRIRKTPILLLLVISTFVLSAAATGGLNRCQDQSGPEKRSAHLTVFYPAQGTIEDLLALRQAGAIDIPGLKVTGIYHILEKTDYSKAEEFILSQGIDWISLYPVRAEVRPEDLFRRNAWTAEFERIVRESDGVIFFGGPDIPPALYSARQSLLTVVEDLDRHYLELSAAFHFLGGSQEPEFQPLLKERIDFPVLGICLGMQTMNVATGGTMIQDIWSETYKVKTVEEAIALDPEKWHTNPQAKLFPKKTVFSYFFHPLVLRPKGKLAALTALAPGDRPYVLSAHHQQAARLGRGLRVEATSADGKVIEAVSHERFPRVLGVQFHPEFDILWQGDTPYNLTLQDSNPPTVRQYLTAHPPSLEFHRKLWAWFSRQLEASARSNRQNR
jgi:putative glutamine amidotransferase